MPKPRVRIPAAGWAYLFLAMLWAGSMALTLCWLRVDQRPMIWDQLDRFLQSVSIYQILAHPSGDVLAQIAAAHPFYPPLVALVAAGGYALAGVSADVAIAATSGLFLAVLLLSTYDLGRSLAGPRVGVLAALLVATYPAVFGSRDALDIDLALTAQVALFMALAVRSEGFRRRGWSVAAGVAAGLALLTKWLLPVFVAAPALYLLWRAWRAGGSSRRLAANVGLALACCLLLAAAWWAYTWRYILFDYMRWAAASGPSEGDPQLLAEPFWALNYYLLGLNYQLSAFHCLLLAAAIPVFFAARKVPAWHKIVLGAWVVIPYIWLTAVANKEPRYFEPAYPAMALITASAVWLVLDRLRRRGVRAAVVGVLAAAALFQFYSITFPLSWVKANTFVPRVPNDGNYAHRRIEINLYSQWYGYAPHVDPDDWHADEIVDLVAGYPRKQRGLRIFVFSEQPQLRSPLVCHSYMADLDYVVQPVGTDPFREDDYVVADYIVLHTPPQVLTYRTDSDEIAANIREATERFATLNAERGEFELVRTLDLHDGSRITIYERVGPPPGA